MSVVYYVYCEMDAKLRVTELLQHRLMYSRPDKLRQLIKIACEIFYSKGSSTITLDLPKHL